MKEMWDERYREKEYVYGTKPNAYFAQAIQSLKPGKILLPAEGEGRNAVFAAQQGWDVTAFDISEEGQKKALTLAEEHNVQIMYKLASFQSLPFEPESFDAIALVFAHMPVAMRQNVHHNLLNLLKKNGHLILQGFSKEQLNYQSGGPQNIDMLFSKEDLQNDFGGMQIQHLVERKVQLSEGNYHAGEAAVIEFLACK